MILWNFRSKDLQKIQQILNTEPQKWSKLPFLSFRKWIWKSISRKIWVADKFLISKTVLYDYGKCSIRSYGKKSIESNVHKFAKQLINHHIGIIVCILRYESVVPLFLLLRFLRHFRPTKMRPFSSQCLISLRFFLNFVNSILV